MVGFPMGAIGQWIGFHGKIHRKTPYLMGKCLWFPVKIFPQTNSLNRGMANIFGGWETITTPTKQ
jgi:hypothetical protein